MNLYLPVASLQDLQIAIITQSVPLIGVDFEEKRLFPDDFLEVNDAIHVG